MRRLVAAGAAILMAMVGGLLLLTYVHHADQRAGARALAGVQTAPVVVATATISKNTSAAKLTALVAVKQLPRMAIASGAVSDLQQLAGKVATVDIQPGEQLLTSRFADPSAVRGGVTVPAGLEQISVLMEPQRVVAGIVKPGDQVGVYRKNQLIADHVLVTQIQDGAAQTGNAKSASNASATQPAADSKTASQAADGQIMVTLAVTAQQAAAFVDAVQSNGQAPGEVWLSLDTMSEDGTDAH